MGAVEIEEPCALIPLGSPLSKSTTNSGQRLAGFQGCFGINGTGVLGG